MARHVSDNVLVVCTCVQSLYREGGREGGQDRDPRVDWSHGCTDIILSICLAVIDQFGPFACGKNGHL